MENEVLFVVILYWRIECVEQYVMEMELINSYLTGRMCPYLFFEWDGFCNLILKFAAYVDIQYGENLWGCILF